MYYVCYQHKYFIHVYTQIMVSIYPFLHDINSFRRKQRQSLSNTNTFLYSFPILLYCNIFIAKYEAKDSGCIIWYHGNKHSIVIAFNQCVQCIIHFPLEDIITILASDKLTIVDLCRFKKDYGW